MEFLQGLCNDSKVILNLRRNVTAASQSAWFANVSGIVARLNENAAWFHRFAAAHPHSTFLLWFEDMVDPAANETVARTLASFVGAQWPSSGATFGRLKGRGR